MLIKNLLLPALFIFGSVIIGSSGDGEEVLKTPRNNNVGVSASCEPIITHKVFSRLGEFLLDLHNLHGLIDEDSSKKGIERKAHEEKKLD